MADNVTLNSGSGGATLATDDVTDLGGAHYQKIKLADGTANSTTMVNAGGGVEANAIRVTMASDSTGVLTVNGNETENAAVNGNPVLVGARYDLTPRTLNDGDAGALAVDVNGHLITSPHADSVALADTVSNTANIQVDETGSFMVQAQFPYQYNGTTWDRLRGDATDGLLVNLGSNNDVTVTGTVTVDLGANNDVQGDVAHDTADSGNPIKIGAKATNSVEGQTQVAANDRTNLLADLNGVLITRPHTTLEEIISERVADTAGTSTNFTNFAAGGAGVHNYVTTISIYNSSATDGYVDFRDGSAGSVIFTAAAPATGGSVINLPVPLKGAANTALAYDVSGALSTVYITVIGFQAQG